jgi:hypothetical protein
MDLLTTFGALPDAIKALFNMGYVPEEDEFHELTPEQYAFFAEELDRNGDEKFFMLLPKDASKYNKIAVDEVYCYDEYEIACLKAATAMLGKYCQDGGIADASMEEKLRYFAYKLPKEFSKGTPYEKYHARAPLHIVKRPD